MSDKIKCPKCGQEILIDEAIVQKMVALKVQKSLKEKEGYLEQEIKQRLLIEQTTSLKSLQNKLDQSRQKEIESIKKQTELEDRIKTQELEIARKVQEEKKGIEEKAQKDAAAKYELMLAEERKKNADTQKQLRELEQKSRQGSMQTQGEVLELTIEDLLKQSFPQDKIEPVPKGTSGADIIQIVYGPNGKLSGKIAWEGKRAKNWTEDWVQKLKDDSRAIHADIPILVTETLPKEIQNFGRYKNIWICNFSHIIGLATAMRTQLITVSAAIIAETGKDQKMEAIYSYLTSNAFAHKIQSIVETFDQMKQSLDTEKRAMTKIWATRETQILRLTENTVRMYGEIQGIAGKALPTIKLLELDDGIEEKEDGKKDPIDPQSNLFNS